MLKLLITSLFYCGLTFSQNITNPWVAIYQSQESAETLDGIEILKAKYPVIFKDHNHLNLSSAHYSTAVLKYRGVTTCASNDPKLYFQTYQYGICTSKSKLENDCIEVSSLQPELTDPCL